MPATNSKPLQQVSLRQWLAPRSEIQATPKVTPAVAAEVNRALARPKKTTTKRRKKKDMGGVIDRVRKARAQHPTMSFGDIATYLGIAKTTVHRVLTQKGDATTPAGKRGRKSHLLPGEQESLLDSIKQCASAGRSLLYSDISEIAHAIVKVEPSRRQDLLRYGGSLKLDADWARQFCKRHNIVVRAATTGRIRTSAQHAATATFVREVASLVKEHNVDGALLINSDETALSLVPARGNVKVARGTRVVRVGGCNDRKQITANIAVSYSGNVLVSQLIYRGK